MTTVQGKMRVLLQSSPPADPSDPSSFRKGHGSLTMNLSDLQLTLESDPSKPIYISFANISKTQKKPPASLRIQLMNGGAYIFDFLDVPSGGGATVISGAETREQVISWYGHIKEQSAGPAPFSAAVAAFGPSPVESVAAALGGGPGATGSQLAAASNVDALLQGRSSAVRKGVNIAASGGGIPPHNAAARSSSSSSLSSSSSSGRPSNPASGTSSTSASNVFAKSINDPAVKADLLSKKPELAAAFRAIVETGLASAEDFWRLHASSLNDFIVSNSQVRNIPTAMIDELIVTRQSEDGTDNFVLTPDVITLIFLKEPVIHSAFKAYVPTRMSKGDFFSGYVASKRECEKLEHLRISGSDYAASSSAGGGGGLGKQGSGSNNGSGAQPSINFADLDPSSFFDGIRRGEIRLSTGLQGGAGGKAGILFNSRTPALSKRSLHAIDASIDLISSLEDVGREATGLEGAGSANLKQRHPSSALASNLSTEVRESVDADRRRTRTTEQIMQNVNKHSTVVIAHMAPAPSKGGGGGGGGGAASSRRPPPPQSNDTVGTSSVDDLTDLYKASPKEATFMPLSVDMGTLRASLEASAGASATAVPSSSSSFSSSLGSAQIVLATTVPSPETAAHHQSGFTPPLEFLGQKRIRAFLDAEGAGAAAKRVAQSLAHRASTSFSSQSRTSDGFLALLSGGVWPSFLRDKMRTNKELLSFFWGAWVSTAHASSSHERAHRDSLLAAVEAEYTYLQSLRHALSESDPFHCVPAVALASKGTAGTTASNGSSFSGSSAAVAVAVSLGPSSRSIELDEDDIEVAKVECMQLLAQLATVLDNALRFAKRRSA